MASVSGSIGAASPRFTPLHVLKKRYCVVAELRRGYAFQLLRVVDAQLQAIRVVKVLSRSAMEDEVINANLSWLLRRKEKDDRYSKLLVDFSTPHDWFFVFECPRVTMKDVLSRDELTPLPPPHVCEITLQVVMAISSLQKRSILHLDICPSTIELVDVGTLREVVCDRGGRFTEKIILRCRRVRVVFYGDAGIRTEQYPGTDQYRAPEVVFGWVSKRRSDNFSIGCVLWEMTMGRPLFVACTDEDLYVKAKARLFAAILGPIPDYMKHRVSLYHAGVFLGGSSDDLADVRGLSPALQTHMQSTKSVEEELEDEHLLDVVRALTMISPRDRLSLAAVRMYQYFDMLDR